MKPLCGWLEDNPEKTSKSMLLKLQGKYPGNTKKKRRMIKEGECFSIENRLFINSNFNGASPQPLWFANILSCHNLKTMQAYQNLLSTPNQTNIALLRSRLFATRSKSIVYARHGRELMG
jgi:hypothetical protein